MTCKACGLPELRYAICDRWLCEHTLPRQAIEEPSVCSGLQWGDVVTCDADHFIATGQLVVLACSQCGKYPCECDDC